MKRQHLFIPILVALGLTTAAVASLRHAPDIPTDRPPVPIRTAPVTTPAAEQPRP